MEKPNLKDQRIAQLENERDCLFLALNDLANGRVKWATRGSKLQLGICRPEGAAGGIVIHKQEGYTLGAYYFETWLADVRRTAETIQSEDAIRLRDCANELAQIAREMREAAYKAA